MKAITIKVVGPQNYFKKSGDIEFADAYGIALFDGVEYTDIEYPFASKEEAEERLIEIEMMLKDNKYFLIYE